MRLFLQKVATPTKAGSVTRYRTVNINVLPGIWAENYRNSHLQEVLKQEKLSNKEIAPSPNQNTNETSTKRQHR